MSYSNETPVDQGHEEHVGHVVSFWLLFVVWAALMVLTYITVTAAGRDWGDFNLMIAMGIATVKASLVVLFFMHLAFDRPFNAFVFITSLSFVALFVILSLVDSTQYQNALIPGYAPNMPPR